MEQFIKGFITSTHTLQITERDLLSTQKEALSKAKRKALKGNVVQKDGVITIKDVRQKWVTCMENEVEKHRKALVRAENKKKRDCEALHKKVTKAFKAIGKELKEVVKARETRLKH